LHVFFICEEGWGLNAVDILIFIFKNLFMDRILSKSCEMKNAILDDDYTLYESGFILHEYDESSYPGKYNLKAELNASELTTEVKHRLLYYASEEDKELVKNLLEMD